MIDSTTLALSAILTGLLLAGVFIWGYYSGRKDQTPSDRKAAK